MQQDFSPGRDHTRVAAVRQIPFFASAVAGQHKNLIFDGPRLQQGEPMPAACFRPLGAHERHAQAESREFAQKFRKTQIVANGESGFAPWGPCEHGFFPGTEDVLLLFMTEEMDFAVAGLDAALRTDQEGSVEKSCAGFFQNRSINPQRLFLAQCFELTGKFRINVGVAIPFILFLCPSKTNFREHNKGRFFFDQYSDLFKQDVKILTGTAFRNFKLDKTHSQAIFFHVRKMP